jgi:hypothetical protein
MVMQKPEVTISGGTAGPGQYGEKKKGRKEMKLFLG